ncbi:MAG: hypothetical protein LBC28_04430 [Oscillospiraceae bacterium]|jgi:REP element-mobilizing transposase RayT|nr:hypothetical protein [Oscillospiraceae bacterium]
MRELRQRKRNRWAGYDYSRNGAYFVTICVKDRHELLGRIICDAAAPVGARIARPSLSETGKVVQEAILNISKNYPLVSVDCFVIMPNHIHMILRIRADSSGRAMRAPTISTVINQMKGWITKRIGFSIWQKLFHDHIIRNADDYNRIAEYIQNNPTNWEDDCLYGEEETNGNLNP